MVSAAACRGRRRASKVFEGAPFDAPLPARLVSTLLARAAIDPASHLDHVSDRQVRDLVDAIKKLTLSVVGLEDPEQAIVTLGGVSTKDVDPRTMRSRIVGGLYLAGELIDPAGPCGGYNLLQAFATGWLAGGAGHGPQRRKDAKDNRDKRNDRNSGNGASRAETQKHRDGQG